MPQDIPKNNPKGQIRTMAKDLAKVREQISEEPGSAKNKILEPAQAPKTQDDNVVKSLDELLPLEESDSENSTTEQKNESSSIPENLPVEPNSSSQPPAPPPVPGAPFPVQKPSKEESLSNLESEIFPDPNLEPPDQKSKQETPMPSSLSEEKIPEEEIPLKTPEELLGLDEIKSKSPPLAPPPITEGKQKDSTKPEEKKEYKPLSPEPESFHLSMGKLRGPLYPQQKDEQAKGKSSNSANKMLILGSVIVLAAVLAGGIVYFFFFGGKELIFKAEPQEEEESYQTPEEQTPPPPPVVKITAPTPLVTPDLEQEGLTAANTQQNTLEGVIQKIKNDFVAPSLTITYMPIQLGSIPEGGEAEFIQLQQFLQGLSISVPEGFYDTVEPNLMLWAYSAGENERIMCQNNLIYQKDCYGARLGLVVKARQGKKADLNTIAAQWEKQLAVSNFGSLLLNDLASIPKDISFTSEEYQSEAIVNAPTINLRFVNLPMPSYDNIKLSTTSIDIAVVDNFLVISTSKKSMHAMIDKILQIQP